MQNLALQNSLVPSACKIRNLITGRVREGRRGLVFSVCREMSWVGDYFLTSLRFGYSELRLLKSKI